MSGRRWFILTNERVIGPYNDQEVLDSIKQGLWPDGRFWFKGQTSWTLLSQFHITLENEKQKTMLTQNTKPLWYIKELQSISGPFSFEKLIIYLKSKTNHKNIYVSQETTDNWKDIFQFDAITEKLNINRRAHPRVPIEGTLAIIEGPLKGQKGEVFSLSEGGIGARGIETINLGERIKGTINCKSLSLPIHFQAEVVFLNTNKTKIGFKFTNLSTEALSQIIAYVKQFVEAHPETDFRKVS